MDCNPLLLLLLALLQASYGAETPCLKDEECPKKDNKTQSCCMNKKYEVEGVCKTSCYGEYCTLSLDCGSAQDMFCCDDHTCRRTYKECPSPKWPTWITVVVVLAVVLPVLGIGGVTCYICWRHRHRNPSGSLLVDDSSAHGTGY